MPPPQPLRGVITATITPRTHRAALGGSGLARIVEHLISGGVHRLGNHRSGLAPQVASRYYHGNVSAVATFQWIVGMTDTVLEEAVQLASKAKELGAQAVVTSAPYYYLASQAELLTYLEKRVAALPPPVFLYNSP